MDSHIAAKRGFTFNGENYVLSPITIAELKELEHYLRSRPIAEIKPQLAGLSIEDRQYLLDKAYAAVQASPIRIANKEFNEALKSMDSVAYLLYLSLRTHRPEITQGECGQLLQSEIRDDVVDMLLQISGLKGDVEKKAKTQAAIPA